VFDLFGRVVDGTLASGAAGVLRNICASALDDKVNFNITQRAGAAVDLGGDTICALDSCLHVGDRVAITRGDISIAQGSVKIVLSTKFQNLGKVINDIFVLCVRRAIAGRSVSTNTST
jgi:hypothetical protein